MSDGSRPENQPGGLNSGQGKAASTWRIAFFGSTAFSLPALRALHQGPDEVVLVVCPPPSPAGRGRKISPSPVSELAADLGLPRLESRSVKSGSIIEKIGETKPDLLVVAAYGGFLPKALLEMCPYPPLNIHPSLLPRHRGAAPVNWGLISGDEELGVSIIFLEEEMDAGPILSQRAFKIGSNHDSAGIWEERLARAGAEDLLKVISALKNGTARPKPQDRSQISVNPLLAKADGLVNFSRPAHELAALINGVDPWPGAQSGFQGKSLKIFGASFLEGPSGGEPGQVLGVDDQKRLMVATGSGILLIRELQPEGKKKMPAADFSRGYRPERLGF